MKPNSLYLTLLSLYLFFPVPLVRAQLQNTYYVYRGTTLQVMYDNPARANYRQWQVWLYQDSARIPQTGDSPYSRWGLIEGRSAESVMKQLEAFQSFEKEYLNFFGSGTWGKHTFFNPAGPIAITDRATREKPSAQLFELGQLNYRVTRLIRTVQPSLENNEREDPGSPLKEYFDRVRDSLEQVTVLYRQLDHIRPQRFINEGILRTRAAVAQAENDAPKIIAFLPSVKLPTSDAWMSNTEWAGGDGTVQVRVTEAGSAVLVQQTWTGGDGSLTGTVVLTIIPYEDIGSVEVEPTTRGGEHTWRVQVQSARTSFPQTRTFPERKTAKRVFRAVNYATMEHSVHFVFLSPAEAQDAYAYFEYHRQRSQ